MGLNGRRRFQSRKKALSQAQQLSRIIRTRYEQYKFISHQPNRHIMRPDFLAQNIAQLYQNPISNRMPKLIIDRFKMIQIKLYDPK
ncbi:hypothetical protein N9370_04465 [Paracoccaceae bacterium]|nr:hypothetical protein [Paracoccaceae bacterium]